MKSILVLVLVSFTACAKPRPFLEQRAASPTVLTMHMPSPQPGEDAVPEGATEIFYESEGRRLRAWLVMPANATGKVPAVVFFHGGFALGADDVTVARPFVDAGYALLLPALRGENGNPGDFEYFRGEFDDARAAVTWMSKQPDIDASRISVFGHSAGGIMAAMFSLCDAPKLQLVGSAAGLYDTQLFTAMRLPMPFDEKNETEKRLRVFAPNADLMQRKLIGYVGNKDPLVAAGAKVALKRAPEGLLEVKLVEGGHQEMLVPAIAEFVKRLKATK